MKIVFRVLLAFVIFFPALAEDESYSIVTFSTDRMSYQDILKEYDLNICDAHLNPDGSVTALVRRQILDSHPSFLSDYRVDVPDADTLLQTTRIKEDSRGSGYYSYETAKELFLNLARDYSDICKYEVIGKSFEGRDIFALKISDNPSVNEDEPAVLYLGMHHSREWISVEVPVGTALKLCEGYNKESEITYLVNNREFWIVPIVNPDGFIYSQTNSKMWRKNRRKNSDGTYGVDPNRNYGYQWGNVGASNSPSSDTYHGTGPFSELCTQAIKKFAEREKFAASISYHSHGELILWPWSYTGSEISPHEEILKKVAFEMAEFNHYDPKQSSGLYPSMGDTDDFLHGTLGTLSYTVELGNSFIPSESEIPRIVADNTAAALHLAKRCGNLWPAAEFEQILSTTDSVGPYIAKIKLDTVHHPDVQIERAKLVYSSGSFDRTVDFRRNGNAMTAEIPGAPHGTKFSYYVELKVKGSDTVRFPESGKYNFAVCSDNILIVDNDGGKAYEKYFSDAISALGDAAVTVVDPSKKPIDDALLAAHTCVIWISGDKTSGIISDKEMSAVKKYYDAGGSVFFTGQDIGYSLKNNAFMADVLHGKYIDDNAKNNNISGSGIFDGFSCSITGGDGASNQKYPDVIDTANGGDAVLKYGNGKTAGVVCAQTGKSVYLGFGFEAVSKATDRTALMKKIMAFLSPSLDMRLRYLKSLDLCRDEMLKNGFNEQQYMNIISLENSVSERIIKMLDSTSENSRKTILSDELYVEFAHILTEIDKNR